MCNTDLRRHLFITLFTLLLAVSSYAQRITVSGFVLDAETKESLIGAAVYTAGLGSVTDNDGRFSITFPIDKADTLFCSYAGYRTESLAIHFHKDTTVIFSMIPGEELAAATVSARAESGIQSTLMSVIKVPVEIVRKSPVVLGEADVLKTLQMLPGVQSGMEGTSGLFVRGGGADENLYLLDGVPLYNVNHLLGIFSAFTPEAVKKVTLYKSAFPARFGGRVSGIVDVRTNDGNAESFQGSIGIGMLSDKLHLEWPLFSGRTSFSITGRVLHTLLLEPVIKRAGIDVNYFFYDLNGKITHRFSDKDRLFLTFYNGDDHFIYNGKEDGQSSTETSGIQWGSLVGTIRWNHNFNGKWNSNLSLSGNFYRMNSAIEEKTQQLGYEAFYSSKYGSGIKDWTVNYDMDYVPSPFHFFRFGTSSTWHDYTPQAQNVTTYSYLDKPAAVHDSSFHYEGLESALYAEDEVAFGKWLTMNPGLRYVLMTTDGRVYHSLEPRLSARAGLGRGFAVKAAYTRMSQYVHLLSTSQLSLPTDIWVPITEKIKPVETDQFSAGIYWEGKTGWEFSLESYYKSSENIIDYRDGISLFGTTASWDEVVEMGQGRSYGIELYLARNAGPTTAWLSYTLSKSERRYPGGYINKGEWFPFKYDRRHVISLFAMHRFNKRLDITGNWSFMSGGYLTLPDRTTVVLKVEEANFWTEAYRSPVYYTGVFEVTEKVPGRSNYHLPPSHSLNLSLNLRTEKKHGWSVWSFGLYNTYNQMNPNLVFVNTRTEADRNEGASISLEQITLLPILPSVSYSYNFK